LKGKNRAVTKDTSGRSYSFFWMRRGEKGAGGARHSGRKKKRDGTHPSRAIGGGGMKRPLDHMGRGRFDS